MSSDKAAVRDGAIGVQVQGLWVPKVGQHLVVELPGERLLTKVARVVSPDVVIVELDSMPLGKSHTHRQGEFVPCERINASHETIWRSFNLNQKAAVADKPKAKRRRKIA